MLPVAICRLPHGLDLPLPERATPHAAGMDLRAALPEPSWVLAPGERRMVPTGLVMAIPPGYEGQVRPRSGLAARHGVTVLNAPGTIDADYRGEVQVMLVNHGSAPFKLDRGERIAQIGDNDSGRLFRLEATPSLDRRAIGQVAALHLKVGDLERQAQTRGDQLAGR